MTVTLPFSQACENNKDVILTQLFKWVREGQSVLEIGTGTAQHAVHFAAAMPAVIWQCADQLSYHNGIRARLEQAGLANLQGPLVLEATSFDWSARQYDIVFTANTAHIMPWSAVQATMQGVDRTLAADGYLIWYGPFNKGGRFTSESNRRFHADLQSRSQAMGIRDLEQMTLEAHQNGLELIDTRAMPANNQLLVFQKAL